MVSSARAVRIPVRNAYPEGVALEVRVFLEGSEADRLLLPPDHTWRVQRLILKRCTGRFCRIDLNVYPAGRDEPVSVEPTDRSGAIHVGRPFVEE